MKILGLEGGPRKDGNTEKLVHAILDGAAEHGAEKSFFKLADMDISGCKSCYTCKTKGRCVIEDDMQALYDEIQASDAIVLGSPVYMWQVTAQTKLFMDRLIAFIAPDFSTRLNGPKKLILAYTQGNPDEKSFQTYFEYMEKLFAFLHFDVKATLAATGTRDKNDILGQADLLDTARTIGADLVG